MTECSAQSGARIITFYSYKGGTGRSMAVANIAWILASNGKRVLVIDWDLEAPGLHRYFHPFLEDVELTSTEGLIDFFVAFVAAAKEPTKRKASSNRPWFEAHTSLARYAFSVDWDFPNKGTIDLVPAGRQDSGYAERVNSFDWQRFYEDLGGGVFLEAVKRNLRAEYDYILIDSRTGTTDSSGICTVQMPDDLVVCFTFNRQSIEGAAAVAESAYEQRRGRQDRPGIRVWPVPTRVELSERDRLEKARKVARQRFDRYLMHLPRKDRAYYWGDVEVLYQPYYAFEEILAALKDEPHQRNSILSSMEAITKWVSNRLKIEVHQGPKREREAALEKYELVEWRRKEDDQVFLIYRHGQSMAAAKRLAEDLQRLGFRIWFDMNDIEIGADWSDSIRLALNKAAAVIVIIGPDWETQLAEDDFATREVAWALEQGMLTIPVLVDDAEMPSVSNLPSSIRGLARRNALVLSSNNRDEAIYKLDHALKRAVKKARQYVDSDIDSEDPQKGRWGGKPVRDGYRLSASVREVAKEWFRIQMTVESAGDKSLEGTVEFHLHDSLRPNIVTVPARDNRAELAIGAYGGFTVGAVLNAGDTTLELDLCELSDAPDLFRQR